MRLDARRRAAFLATRMGAATRTARLAAGLRQADVAERAGIAQSFVSRIERGAGQAASVETWSAVAAAVGTRLAAFLEHAPGASLPRDYEHLKRQRLVVETAANGGWTATVERAIDPTWDHPRSVDIFLERGSGELAVVEVWDLVDDVGAAFRGLDAKVGRIARDRPQANVAGLIVVRGTATNRRLVREFGAVFRAHFPASSAAWLAALTGVSRRMPADAGFIWTDVGGTRLMAARL